jgi:hypothetical protein
LASFSLLIQNSIVLIPQTEEIVNPFVSTNGRYISAKMSVAEIDIRKSQTTTVFAREISAPAYFVHPNF